MVKGLKGIFGYGKSRHISNYQLFKLFKRAYHLLDFQKAWIFYEHQNVIVWSQVLFQNQTIWNVNVLAQLVQKVGKCLSKRICSRQWSQIFKFKTICKPFFISCFRNFQSIMHKCLKHKSIYFIHVRIEFFFKKYTQKCNLNRNTYCPWLVLSSLKTSKEFLELGWICIK